MILLKEELLIDIKVENYELESMKIDDIHQEIKEFIKNLSEDNVEIMERGSIQAFIFKVPKIFVFFNKDGGLIRGISNCLIRYKSKLYSEAEFIRLLGLKVFW